MNENTEYTKTLADDLEIKSWLRAEHEVDRRPFIELTVKLGLYTETKADAVWAKRMEQLHADYSCSLDELKRYLQR